MSTYSLARTDGLDTQAAEGSGTSKINSDGYYGRVNNELLRMIPRTARTVLEFGCGSGALGAAYKRISPNCVWLGVEHCPEIAARARDTLDRVVTADAATLPLADLALTPNSVDCLVYGDVLEHLVDPWASLARHVEALANDGLVLACVPNIQHWTVLLNLLRGRFDYVDEGLLDRTHLRFFTASSLHALFESAGLVVHDVQTRVLSGTGHRDFIRAMASALPALGIVDTADFQRQVSTYQYLVRAGRRRIRPLLVQALTLRPQGAVNDVRIHQPLRAIAAQPGVHVAVQQQKTALCADTSPPDRVFLWQRPIMTHATSLASLRKLMARGYLIVTEFDDDPEYWPLIADNDHLTFKGVHAVQTSTPTLADLLRQWNPEVAVFANATETLPPLTPAPAADARLTLFFGAFNRGEDWAPIMPALNRALARRGDGVHVSVVYDRAFFDALETSAKTFTPLCDYPTYRRLIRAADIALLPLRDTPFNRRKSDLKFIECATQGTVVLASPVVYAETLRDGETGVMFPDAASFEDRLDRLLGDAAWRDRIRRAAHAYVRDHRMQAAQTGARLAWYRDLVARRPALTEAIYQRVPDLRP